MTTWAPRRTGRRAGSVAKHNPAGCAGRGDATKHGCAGTRAGTRRRNKCPPGRECRGGRGTRGEKRNKNEREGDLVGARSVGGHARTHARTHSTPTLRPLYTAHAASGGRVLLGGGRWRVRGRRRASGVWGCAVV